MSEQYTIAIVDDERDMRDSISQWLGLSGYRTRTFATADAALKDVDADFPGIVITDVKMPGTDGVTFLKRLQNIDTQLPVILITGHGDVAMAVEAMQVGAYDFLEKPFDPDRIAEVSRRAIQTRKLTLENRVLRRELSDGTVLLQKLVGSSATMKRLREEILDASQADGNVLIVGETGTGKSMIARAVHACGPRKGRRFAVVNCAAYTEDELKRQLFGPLDTGQPLLEHSLGGSLCLEDVEVLTPTLQARLLEAVSEHATRDETLLRIISVSNLAREGESLDGALRPDLLHQLAALRIFLPPLRKRGDDILSLFNRYTAIFAEEYGCEPPAVSASDAGLLLRAKWPGNIRQLIHVAERAVLLCRRGNYSLRDLLNSEAVETAGVASNGGKTLKEHVEAFERMLIDNALRRYGGSVRDVMHELSLPRRTLNEKMAKYGLNRSDYLT